MSIIEKALEKLDKGGARATPDEGQVVEARQSADGLEEYLGVVTEEDDEPILADVPGAQGGSSAKGRRDRRKSNRESSRSIELNLNKLSSMGMVTPRTANSIIAEQYRIIKRPLLTKAEAGKKAGIANSNLIMVTSALPSEGKTFTSINLAMSMAMELDKTVLLIDADGAKSDVTRTLEIDSVEGLTDVLLDKDMDLSDVLLKTSVPKLSVLPAGRSHTNVTELLASNEMRSLTDELATRYADRIVIFDTPPLLATSGAVVLARLVGQVVMVVRAEQTLQSYVKDALHMMEGVENIGIVLNRNRQLLPKKYGYGYGYGYGQH